MEEGQFHQFENSNEDDFPEAEEFHDVQEDNNNDFKSQKEKVKEVVKKINKDRSTVDICFKTKLSEELIPFLKSKGYDIKYYQNYDSRDDSYMTRVIITNPSFKSHLDNMVEKVETQFKNFGFGGASTINMNDDAKKILEQMVSSFT